MLRVHLIDGTTLSFDLINDVRAWRELVRDHAFQRRISGLTLQNKGALYSLSRPIGFTEVFLDGEFLAPEPDRKFKGGERLLCQAGETRAVVLVHAEHQAVRVSLARTGRLAYNPRMESVSVV
jgi:hypothetical protein